MNAFETYIQKTSELLATLRKEASSWSEAESVLRELGFTDRQIGLLHAAWDVGI